MNIKVAIAIWLAIFAYSSTADWRDAEFLEKAKDQMAGVEKTGYQGHINEKTTH